MRGIVAFSVVLVLGTGCSSDSDNSTSPTEQADENSGFLTTSNGCGSGGQSNAAGVGDSSVEELSCVDVPKDLIDVDGLPSTGSGNLDIAGQTVTLNNAIVEEYQGFEYPDHSAIGLELHNGETRFVQRSRTTAAGDSVVYSVGWGVYGGSAVLSVELLSTAQDQFSPGTFEYTSDDEIDPERSGFVGG